MTDAPRSDARAASQSEPSFISSAADRDRNLQVRLEAVIGGVAGGALVELGILAHALTDRSRLYGSGDLDFLAAGACVALLARVALMGVCLANRAHTRWADAALVATPFALCAVVWLAGSSERALLLGVLDVLATFGGMYAGLRQLLPGSVRLQRHAALAEPDAAVGGGDTPAVSFDALRAAAVQLVSDLKETGGDLEVLREQFHDIYAEELASLSDEQRAELEDLLGG